MTCMLSGCNAHDLELVAEHRASKASLGLAVADNEALQDFLGADHAIDAAGGPTLVDAPILLDARLGS